MFIDSKYSYINSNTNNINKNIKDIINNNDSNKIIYYQNLTYYNNNY